MSVVVIILGAAMISQEVAVIYLGEGGSGALFKGQKAKAVPHAAHRRIR